MYGMSIDDNVKMYLENRCIGGAIFFLTTLLVAQVIGISVNAFVAI
jgi:hypothetical protein